jgi:hypothetical protein
MSIENVTYAFQNADITGVGINQFFLEPRFTDSAGSRDATDMVHAYVVVRSMAMHRDQHKVVDCSVLEQSAADNLATIGRARRLARKVRSDHQKNCGDTGSTARHTDEAAGNSRNHGHQGHARN